MTSEEKSLLLIERQKKLDLLEEKHKTKFMEMERIKARNAEPESLISPLPDKLFSTENL